MGVGPLPKQWLRNTFRVRRNHVGEALLWLKEHNKKYYGDIEIERARLEALPDDDVPVEIFANIRQDATEGMATRESAGYGNTEGNEEGQLSTV